MDILRSSTNTDELELVERQSTLDILRGIREHKHDVTQDKPEQIIEKIVPQLERLLIGSPSLFHVNSGNFKLQDA